MSLNHKLSRRKFTALGAATFTAPVLVRAASAELRIGVAISDSGKFAPEGHSTRHGYDIWADQANANGGIDINGTKHKVKLIYYDDQSEPETAIKLVQRLISKDKVHFLFGPYSSGLTIATSAIAAKNNILMFAGAAAANSVFDHGNRFVFSPLSLTSSYTTSGLTALADLGVKSIVVAHLDDAPMNDVKDATIALAKELNLEVREVQAIPPDATDITGALRQLKNANAEVFVEAGTTLTGLLATRTMRDIAWAPRYVLMVQAPTEASFVQELGAKTTRNIMAPTQWMPSPSLRDDYFGTAQEYSDLYKSRYDHHPSYLPPSASAAGLALQIALERAGTTETDTVREELYKLKESTFYGLLQFSGPDDPSGLLGANVHRPMFTIQLDSDGEQRLVAPEDVAEKSIDKFEPWSDRPDN